MEGKRGERKGGEMKRKSLKGLTTFFAATKRTHWSHELRKGPPQTVQLPA